MNLLEIMFESQIEELAWALYESSGEKRSRIVIAWAKNPELNKLGMSEDELQKVWEDCEAVALKTMSKDSPKFYPALVAHFRNSINTLTGFKLSKLENSKVRTDITARTKQSAAQLLSDERRPRSTDLKTAKKSKVKISKINQAMRDVNAKIDTINTKIKAIKAKPNNTATQKERNKRDLASAKEDLVPLKTKLAALKDDKSKIHNHLKEPMPD
jgi:hypothetical protein